MIYWPRSATHISDLLENTCSPVEAQSIVGGRCSRTPCGRSAVEGELGTDYSTEHGGECVRWNSPASSRSRADLFGKIGSTVPIIILTKPNIPGDAGGARWVLEHFYIDLHVQHRVRHRRRATSQGEVVTVLLAKTEVTARSRTERAACGTITDQAFPQGSWDKPGPTGWDSCQGSRRSYVRRNDGAKAAHYHL